MGEKLQEKKSQEEKLQEAKEPKIKFEFTKTEFLRICDEAMLNDLQKNIFEDKIKGLTYLQMSIKYEKSIETIKAYMKKITRKIKRVI